MFKLVIQDDEGKTTVVPLIRDEITIGRKEGNTIRLTERNVSRKHAKISRANGAVAIEDLGSYNGVKVNGTRILQKVTLNVSDRVQIGETVGDVVQRTMLVTRVRTIKNVDVTVPNATVLSSQLINFTTQAAGRGLILHTTVTIGYDVPWRQVHALLIAAAHATEHILPEPAPFVLQTALGDFAVSYQVNGFTDQPACMAQTYSLLHQNIQDRFNEAGVEILSPHYAALRDGNQATLPAEHRRPGSPPPAFRVANVTPGGPTG